MSFTPPPRFIAALLALCLLSPVASLAMMAGAVPDSPASRVDPVTADSSWSGVVAVRVGGNVYSGVLLANRYVLTAAHVASGSVANPADIKLVFNLPAGPSAIAASHIDVFPGFSFPYDDLALIQLSADAPAGATRYAVQDAVITPAASSITLVGYGGSGQGNVGPSIGSNESIRRVGENVVDALTERVDASGHTSSFYLYDFDGPSGNGPMGGGTLGNARETMVAGGDSGSPAFVMSAGRTVVMGINTFATSLSNNSAISYTFGQGGGGMRLSDPRFIHWLRATSANEIHLASEPVSDSSGVTIPLMAGAGLVGGLLMAITVARRKRE